MAFRLDACELNVAVHEDMTIILELNMNRTVLSVFKHIIPFLATILLISDPHTLYIFGYHSFQSFRSMML